MLARRPLEVLQRHPVLVADVDGVSRNKRLIEAVHGDIVDLAGSTDPNIAHSSFVVVDVDLANAANVRKLRKLMAGCPDAEIVFAIDRHRRIETVYAGIFNATAIVDRPLTLSALLPLLAPRHEVVASPRVRKNPEGEAVLKHAAHALQQSFLSLVGGERLEPDLLAPTIETIADAIEDDGFASWMDRIRQHHRGTFQHCLLVTSVATRFGQFTGMGPSDIQRLSTAGLLHDVGKAAIPTEILDKPGALTKQEMQVIRSHPVVGHSYLLANSALGDDVLAAVRGHHEFLDGSGYPDGLSGDSIDDLTRILTVSDIFGALTELRSYKPPMSFDGAIGHLRQLAEGGKVEMALVAALERAVR